MTNPYTRPSLEESLALLQADLTHLQRWIKTPVTGEIPIVRDIHQLAVYWELAIKAQEAGDIDAYKAFLRRLVFDFEGKADHARLLLDNA